ncbi:hypothetical protein P168DRAFT_93759 [Aspergillus campestris IBT 28561]|uniref:Uncharacterized protein n=1 Tax=Aspergillus campestris (strain IBT 28561) TaxID=1392248 RepID=A0A2I1DBT8_ASPC2|nr:uncharacterized protein P168DRAFT_93759 [Aspergillus campestris IBT 28561]PKY07328.1 hypothetical protein P168DRAFT_93759 [Aspergillus campestris IBT 28561]
MVKASSPLDVDHAWPMETSCDSALWLPTSSTYEKERIRSHVKIHHMLHGTALFPVWTLSRDPSLLRSLMLRYCEYAILRYRVGWPSCLALCPARQPSLLWRDFLISVPLKGAYVGTSGKSSAFAIDSLAKCLDCNQGYILLKRGARLRLRPPHCGPVSSRLTMRELLSNNGNALEADRRDGLDLFTTTPSTGTQ